MKPMKIDWEESKKRLAVLKEKEGKSFPFLKLEECKDGYLYEINARNASYGVFREKHADFVILRTKFYDTFLFEEIHWDASPDFGTVRPLKEVEKSPFTGEDFESCKKTNDDGVEYWSRKGDVKAMHEYLEFYKKLYDEKERKWLEERKKKLKT